MTERHWRRLAGVAMALGMMIFGLPERASAQLDPLLVVKRSIQSLTTVDYRAHVLLAVDTSPRMQYDADGAYYDPAEYDAGNPWDSTLGLTPLNTLSKFRRKYVDLQHITGGTDRFSTASIAVTGDLQGAAYTNFYAKTRLGVAKAAIAQAIQENLRSVRFGLLKTRQANPRIVSQLNEGPVLNLDAAQESPTDGGADARWLMTRSVVDSENSGQPAPSSPNFAVVKADVSSANADVLALLGYSFTTTGALLPAGMDAYGVVDSPLSTLLQDAKSEAQRLITADSFCRNTIAVLIVGGGEGTAAVSQTAPSVASGFLSISSRRVPIYVIALAPASTEVAELQSIASNSGGQYFEITKEQIDTAVDAGVTAVPEVVRAINLAVQHGFAKPSDVNTGPTTDLPYGPQSEFLTASPIVGTVDLEGLVPANEWELVKSPAGVLLPQRSNVMVTAGFALPGFDARLRAFRVYEPVPDTSKPSGYRFDADGTLLWTAEAPSASERNIFTALPDGTMVAFNEANAGTLSPYLNTFDATGLIEFVRGQPLGAIVSATPAILDPPSIDPAPDVEYPAFISAHEERRALVMIGANDGMLHAIDARTGLEVWAFIPFNLLPKLKTLRDGQPLDSFGYFVDSSAKIADIKVSGATGSDEWRTYLFVGEGAGGTFYQAFDVTMDGLSSCVGQTAASTSTLLGCFNSTGRISLKWSFPDYSHFDYTYSSAAMPFGDLGSSATAEERTVGQTWSDPAVAQAVNTEGEYVVITGSGFFPYTAEQNAAGRGVPAGRALYLLSASTGQLRDYKDVGSDSIAETVDDCSVASPKGCSEIKNALQADPIATGPTDTRFVNAAYIGDLDGKVWKFTIGLDATSGDPRFTADPSNLYSGASASHPLFSSMAFVEVGGTQKYLFFGTGSELLPTNGVSLQYKLVGLLEGSSTSFSIGLTKTDGSADDEKVTAFPAVAGDIVFFTTTSLKPTAPCTLPDAHLYAVTFAGGAAYESANDNDTKFSNNESTKVKTIAGQGRATAPFIVDQHLWFGAGDKISSFGDPQDFNNGVGQIGVRILSWRQLR